MAGIISKGLADISGRLAVHWQICPSPAILVEGAMQWEKLKTVWDGCCYELGLWELTSGLHY